MKQDCKKPATLERFFFYWNQFYTFEHFIQTVGVDLPLGSKGFFWSRKLFRRLFGSLDHRYQSRIIDETHQLQLGKFLLCGTLFVFSVMKTSGVKDLLLQDNRNKRNFLVIRWIYCDKCMQAFFKEMWNCKKKLFIHST